MKILFVQTHYPAFLSRFYQQHPAWKKYSYTKLKKLLFAEWFVQANFYSRHFQNLGWESDEVIFNDANLQSKWLSEHHLPLPQLPLGFVNRLPGRIRNLLGLNQEAKKILFRQVANFQPDIIYIHDLWMLNRDELSRLKQTARLIVGQIASPIPTDLSAVKSYDLIISSFPHFVRKFRALGIKSEYLQWCFESAIWDKLAKKTQNQRWGAVYVGGVTHLHSKGNAVLEKMARAGLVDFWGYGYGPESISPRSAIKKHFHGPAFGKDMYEIFQQAKIVINRHIDVAENYANNMRLYEATGMGTLLITDAKKNLSDIFIPGREVETYSTPEELAKKVNYYLSHESERQKIALAGQRRTLKDHSYKVRMAQLSKILKKHYGM